MIIPYIGVVLLVTLLFFVMYIYAVRKLDIFSANLKTIIAMCLISTIISVLLPLGYVYYGITAVAVLLMILAGCSVFTASMLVGNKKTVVCGTFRTKDAGWHKCLMQGLGKVYNSFLKAKPKTGMPEEMDELLQMADSEGMNAFKFIISSAGNDEPDDEKGFETDEASEQESLPGGEKCCSMEGNTEAEENDTYGDKELTGEDTGDIDDILDEIDGVEEDDIEAVLGELEEETLHDGNQAPDDKDNGGESPGEFSESSFDIYRSSTNEKYVDSQENIDKMRVESSIKSASYPCEGEKSGAGAADFQSGDEFEPAAIEECIDGVFLLKQAGRLEEAALYYMRILDNDCPKDLILMILLDVCAIYKQLGRPEAAKNVLEGYLSKFEGVLKPEAKYEIEKNL